MLINILISYSKRVGMINLLDNNPQEGVQGLYLSQEIRKLFQIHTF